jgi:hypothetical protein
MKPTKAIEAAQPSSSAAPEITLHVEQCRYLDQLFDSDEREVRQLERYLLVANAAIFSFLANQITKADYAKLWYFPVVLTCIAGIRSAALGNRQRVWLKLLAEVEQRWAASITSAYSDKAPGWASLYQRHGSYAVTVSAVLFYLALLAVTIITGWIGAGINHQLTSVATRPVQ